jgi:hypothetical protein
MTTPTRNRAVINTETGQAYAFVSPGYDLIRHETAIEHALGCIPSEWGRSQDEAWLSQDGGKLSARIRFPEAAVAIDNKKDLVAPSVHIFNSYDKSWPFLVIFGAFRFVCSNGMVVGQQFGEYRKKHLGEFNSEELQNKLVDAIDLFEDQAGVWRQWRDVPALPSDYETMVGSLKLGKRAENQIGSLVETNSGLTLDDMKIRTLDKWSLFNLVTQFITHEVKSESSRVNLEARLKAALS